MSNDANITRDRALQLFRYDAKAGELWWLPRPVEHFKDQRSCKIWNTRWAGKRAGTIKRDGYRQICIDYRTTYEHILIWLIETGDYVPMIDHKDHEPGQPLSNHIGNLRLADYSQNGGNARRSRTNTTGFKGVTRCSRTGRFVAYICHRGKKRNLGAFGTPEEAHEAYCKAASELHGDFARLK